MLGRVEVNKLNMMQGGLDEVERYMLFIGRGAGTNEGKLLSLGPDTDLDAVLGAAASGLKTQIEAARTNAGQGWSACVIPMAASANWSDTVDYAMERTNVEGIVLTDPVAAVTEVEKMQAKSESIMARYMRPLFFAGRARQIASDETFEAYQDVIRPLTKNVAADQVTLTPSLWGLELGTYIGRLCKRNVSIADSPMRVKSGSLVGQWTERPVDKNGRLLDMSVLGAIDAMRFSVPQWYAGYNGTYWADGNVLDVQGGDYQVIENLRVIQKCMRRVYPLAVARIGDRSLNQTSASIAAAKTYFMRPLREMSKSTEIMGTVFPGDIMPPQEGDISLTWISRNEVTIGIAAQPYNCPKKIVCNLVLDLSGEAE